MQINNEMKVLGTDGGLLCRCVTIQKGSDGVVRSSCEVCGDDFADVHALVSY
jgi:hypothetical protein